MGVHTFRNANPAPKVSFVRLHPWRDGIDHCLNLIETPEDIPRIESVDICFFEGDYFDGVLAETSVKALDFLRLFDSLGQLPNMSSLIIRVTTMSEDGIKPIRNTTNNTNFVLPRSKERMISPTALAEALPSVADLMSILSSKNNNGLEYLTIIGLPFRADGFNMNGLTELLRIHPSLRSCIFKKCLFSSEHHLEQLQKLNPRNTPYQLPSPTKQRRTQYQFLQNKVAEFSALEPMGETEEKREREPHFSWFAPSETPHNLWLAWCLIPVAACIIYFIYTTVLCRDYQALSLEKWQIISSTAWQTLTNRQANPVKEENVATVPKGFGMRIVRWSKRLLRPGVRHRP